MNSDRSDPGRVDSHGRLSSSSSCTGSSVLFGGGGVVYTTGPWDWFVFPRLLGEVTLFQLRALVKTGSARAAADVPAEFRLEGSEAPRRTLSQRTKAAAAGRCPFCSFSLFFIIYVCFLFFCHAT